MCVFSADVIVKEFGKTPDTNIIGWVEKDNIYGLTSPEEEVRLGDSIDPNDTFHVGCNNWYILNLCDKTWLICYIKE